MLVEESYICNAEKQTRVQGLEEKIPYLIMRKQFISIFNMSLLIILKIVHIFIGYY